MMKAVLRSRWLVAVVLLFLNLFGPETVAARKRSTPGGIECLFALLEFVEPVTVHPDLERFDGEGEFEIRGDRLVHSYLSPKSAWTIPSGSTVMGSIVSGSMNNTLVPLNLPNGKVRVVVLNDDTLQELNSYDFDGTCRTAEWVKDDLILLVSGNDEKWQLIVLTPARRRNVWKANATPLGKGPFQLVTLDSIRDKPGLFALQPVGTDSLLVYSADEKRIIGKFEYFREKKN